MSTIWRILSQRGFVTPQPHKRPKGSYLRFAAEQPNQRWQADITHWRLADDTAIEILNLLDDHSRYCLDSHTRRVFNSPDIDRRFRRAAKTFGNPASLLTDNGAVFTGRSRGHGRVALEVTLHERGISARHSRPYHPQTCGKVERFHQTLKKWLQQPPPAPTTRQLQAQLDTFRRYYNPARPHRALGRTTPAQAYAARTKARPTGTPLHAAHYRIRHDRIDPTGVFTLRHNSRLHHIGIGRRHAGTHVLVLIHDRDIRVLTARRRTTPRTRPQPQPRLPTTTQTVNHVPRHLCTVSRDIAMVPPTGFESVGSCLAIKELRKGKVSESLAVYEDSGPLGTATSVNKLRRG